MSALVYNEMSSYCVGEGPSFCTERRVKILCQVDVPRIPPDHCVWMEKQTVAKDVCRSVLRKKCYRPGVFAISSVNKTAVIREFHYEQTYLLGRVMCPVEMFYWTDSHVCSCCFTKYFA